MKTAYGILKEKTGNFTKYPTTALMREAMIDYARIKAIAFLEWYKGEKIPNADQLYERFLNEQDQ